MECSDCPFTHRSGSPEDIHTQYLPLMNIHNIAWHLANLLALGRRPVLVSGDLHSANRWVCTLILVIAAASPLMAGNVHLDGPNSYVELYGPPDPYPNGPFTGHCSIYVGSLNTAAKASCAGAYFSFPDLNMNIGQTYVGGFQTVGSQSTFCGWNRIGFIADGACVDVYINGNKGWNCYQFYSQSAGGYSYTVELRPATIIFIYNLPKRNGVYTMPADGRSKATPSVTGSPGPITWSIASGLTGATIDTSSGRVTAGTNAGTVKVTAQDASCSYSDLIDVTDCTACGANCSAFGGLDTRNGSVDVRIGMGWSSLADTAGFLSIREEQPSTLLATPQTLHYNFLRNDVDLVLNGQVVRQLKTLAGLANIVTNNSYSYAIELYSLTNVLPKAGGSYPTNGNPPFKTITVENPGNDTNTLRVTDSLGSAPWEYAWLTNGWELVSGNGLRKETKTTVWSDANTLRTVTTTVQLGTNAPVYQKIEQFKTYGYGERMLEEIVGSGNNALTNSYTWTSGGDIQEANRNDGSWEYYLYDASNRPTSVYSSFTNQPVTTNASFCKLVGYDYSTNVISGAGDNGNLLTTHPRRIITSLLGQEVARSYFVALPGERREIQCVRPGAAWNDTDNLVTVTKVFTNGFHQNETQSVLRPDGTADVYQYGIVGPTNTTNIVLSGHSDGTGTNIDQGTETILILSSSSGQVISKTVVEIPSGITTSYETNEYDAYSRNTKTTYLDGSSRQISYDCCMVSSETDRDGTATSYTYDALKRLVTTTRNSITVSNFYDAYGNVLGTVRYGTDSSPMTISGATHDDAARMTSASDALNQTTAYTNYLDGDGQLVKITTFPDTGTRIETYYRDGSLQSVTGTAVFPVRYEYDVESDGGSQRFYTKEIKLDANGNDTSEWTKTYQDGAGRRYKTVSAAASGNPFSISYYNTKGQLTNQVDPDGVSTLYAYNPKGELAYSILDSNRNSTIDYSGADRITFMTNDVVSAHGTYVRRSRAFVWNTSANTSNLLSTVETSVDGLQTWNTIWNDGQGVTSQSATFYAPGSGLRIVTNTAPDNSYTVTTNQYGRLISATRYDSTGAQLGQVTYGYDAHGRQNTVTDARTGTTTLYFNDADQVSGIVTPAPGAGQSGQVTTNYFDSMGRVWKTVLPDGGVVTNDFDLEGQPRTISGARTYASGNGYDAQGRFKSLTNWAGFPSIGARTTTWNYDGYRGFLTGKSYPDGLGPAYDYTDAGRLKTRAWARGTNTTYDYNAAGDLNAVSYNDGSSAVTTGFDRLGRATSVTHGATVSSYSLSDAGLLLSESYSGGILDGLSVTNGYDQFLRRTNLAILNPASSIVSQATYACDAASRLQSVSDGTNSATYSYVANSPLISHVLYTNGNTLRMTRSNQFDNLNRLTNLVWKSGSTTVGSFAYQYNSANQRTRVTLADGCYWLYQYDTLGQVTSAKKYWSDGMPVAGQQTTYDFDDIGNRKSAASGGDQFGANLRSASYGANLLNQYTNRTVPGYVDILGSATNTATVTVNNQPTYRRNDYFRAELGVPNTAASVWLPVTNLAVLNNGTNADIIASVVGNLYVPQTPESFTYDADGNLTSDGRWSYTWDAENRLTSFTRIGSAPSGSKVKVDCQYDYRCRRTQRIVSAWNGSTYVPQSTNRFVYDGWNLIAILDATNGLVCSFTWGLDASGTMQGAGGVGGLLSLTVHQGTNAGTYFYCFDGNHNVAALVAAGDGSTAAQYEYGAFGELIRATGPLGLLNPFLFSTKFFDWETGFYYYGYRYYDPSTGRWLARDSLDEVGGLNLYGFAANSPANLIDRNGLDVWGGISGQYDRARDYLGSQYAGARGYANRQWNDFTTSTAVTTTLWFFGRTKRDLDYDATSKWTQAAKGAPKIAEELSKIKTILENACACCDGTSLVGPRPERVLYNVRPTVRHPILRGMYDIGTGLTQGSIPIDYDTRSLSWPDNYKYTIGSFDFDLTVTDYDCRSGVAHVKVHAINHFTLGSLSANPLIDRNLGIERYENFSELFDDAVTMRSFSTSFSVLGHNFNNIGFNYPSFRMNKGWPEEIFPNAGKNGVFGLMKNTDQHFQWGESLAFKANAGCK